MSRLEKSYVFLKNRYSKESLFLLFAICLLPIHFWAVIRAFNNISWLINRSELDGAISYVFYALDFAFLESILVFLFIFQLSLLVTIRWEKYKLTTIIATLFLLITSFAIFIQYYQYMNFNNKNEPLDIFIKTLYPGNPLRAQLVFIIFLITILILLVGGIILILDRFEKICGLILEFYNRLSVLAFLFLLLDAVGLIVIIFRNIM